MINVLAFIGAISVVLIFLTICWLIYEMFRHTSTIEDLVKPPELTNLQSDQQEFLKNKLIPFVMSHQEHLSPNDGLPWQALYQDVKRLNNVQHKGWYDENEKRLMNEWTKLYKIQNGIQ